MWNLIYGTNEPIYRKETNSWTWKTDCGRQEGGEGSRMDWEFGVNRCKLLPLEWKKKKKERKKCIRGAPCCMVQQVKDLALSLQWLGLLLKCGFDPWPGKFHRPGMRPEKKIIMH